MEIKSEILDKVSNILKIIDSFSNLNIKSPNQKISEILKEIEKNINNSIISVKEELFFLRTKAEWDNYTIGFFGTTNAGKSTIIETLINGNGSTIGTGKKDFTKDVLYYDIPNFPKIKIVDMPGIEGNESEFEEVIGNGISKCHTLYVVIGTNKEPEEGTILKLKKYLKEQGDIFSIINLRGKADKYARNKLLENDNLTKLVERIDLQFRSLFNYQYKNCIYLNAHLAFCVSCEAITPTHQNDKEDYINIFENSSNAYNFSNFHLLTNSIGNNFSDVQQKIAKSNISKISRVVKQIIETLESQNNEKLKQCLLKDIKNEIDLMIEKLNLIVDKHKDYIKNLIDIELSSLKNELTNIVYKGIDEELNQYQMETAVKKITNDFNSRIEKKIKDLVLELETQIKKLFNELESRLKISIDLNFINIDIDFSKTLEKLSNSLKSIFKMISDFGLRLASIILAFLANPIAGIISLVVNVVSFFINFFRDEKVKKEKAKREAYNHINELIKTIKRTVDKELIVKLNILSEEISNELNEITITFEKLGNLSNKLTQSINEIKDIHSQILKLTN